MAEGASPSADASVRRRTFCGAKRALRTLLLPRFEGERSCARNLLGGSPPSSLRDAAPFACQGPAWCAEPKLAEGERRMVDQAGASWNRVVLRMRQLESLRQVS